MKLSELKSEIKKDLVRDDLTKVIKKLHQIINQDSTMYNELIVIYAQLQESNSRFRINTISRDDFYIMKNKIVSSILEFVDRLTENDLLKIDNSDSQLETQKDFQNAITEYEKLVKNYEEVIENLQQDRLEMLNEVDKVIKRRIKEYLSENQKEGIDDVLGLKEKCRDLIAEDNLEPVFKLLRKHFNKNQEEKVNHILGLQNRWTINQQGRVLGQTTLTNFTEENARIVNALLIIISSLK